MKLSECLQSPITKYYSLQNPMLEGSFISLLSTEDYKYKEFLRGMRGEKKYEECIKHNLQQKSRRRNTEREKERELDVNHKMKQISVQKNLSDKEIMLICLRWTLPCKKLRKRDKKQKIRSDVQKLSLALSLFYV